MTITLNKNIIITQTSDENYVEIKPSLENIKNNIYSVCGSTDDRLSVYDLLYALMGETAIPMVTITIESNPSDAIVKLKIIK